MKTVIVGNGPSALAREMGSVIDAYDRVVRLNLCRTLGFEKHIGSKTDVWVVRYQWTLGHIPWPGKPPAPKPIVMLQHWAWNHHFDKLRARGVPFTSPETDAEVEGLVGRYYASTGLIACVAFKPCDVYGFDHWTLGNHYGDAVKCPGSHSGEKEKSFFDEMERRGWIHRL